MTEFIAFLTAVFKQVAVHYICKWLDELFADKD